MYAGALITLYTLWSVAVLFGLRVTCNVLAPAWADEAGVSSVPWSISNILSHVPVKSAAVIGPEKTMIAGVAWQSMETTKIPPLKRHAAGSEVTPVRGPNLGIVRVHDERVRRDRRHGIAEVEGGAADRRD